MTREATAQAAVMILRESSDKHYSSKILDAFSDVSRRLFRSEVILMKTEMLDEHMVLDEDLKSVAGMLLVSKGSPITDQNRHGRLKFLLPSFEGNDDSCRTAGYHRTA